jgi:hypothetical protein
MSLFNFFDKPKPAKFEFVCPKHGYQSTILNFEYAVNKKFCFECIAEKLPELGIHELVKKELK